MANHASTRAHRRRWALVGVGGAMGALMVASAAMACTPIMGPIRVCSPSTATCTDTTTGTMGKGAEGSTVKVRAWGLKAKPAKYALYMGPGDCHQNNAILKTPSGALLNAMKTNTNGELDRDLTTAAIEPIKAALPEVSNVPGEYSWGICAEETYPVATATGWSRCQPKSVLNRFAYHHDDPGGMRWQPQLFFE